MTTTLDKDYQFTLPTELRGKMGFKVGIPLELTVFGKGFVVVPLSFGHSSATIAHPPADNDGITASAQERYLQIMDELWNSESDPTMVAPPDLPWDADTPRMPIE